MTVESLTILSDAELLLAVKHSLNITGTQFDTTLQMYINEVKEYLKSAGVSYSTDCNVVCSTLAVGCIARGVSDLWNYGNGDTKLSEYFYQRALQLTSVKIAAQNNIVLPIPQEGDEGLFVQVDDDLSYTLDNVDGGTL